MNKKNKLIGAVLCTIASVGFVMSASAEETMQGQLDEVVVEGEAGDLLPQVYNGGNIAVATSGNLLGNKSILDNPFTSITLTNKTIEDYGDPSQPISSVLINDPSVRTSSSTMYNDISIRGLNLNGYQMFLNGVPGLFAQNNLPVNFVDRVEVTSGPSMSINAATPSQSAAGTVNMVSKRAGYDNSNKFTQTFSGKGTFTEEVDVSRRLGEDKKFGIRVNAMNQHGETSIPGEKLTNRNIFINLDQQSDKSNTNFLMGYRYTKHENGLRWFGLDSKNVTTMPSAPDSKNNFSFNGQFLEYDQWITTLNHEQKINDTWTAFFNGGYSRYDLFNNLNSKSSKYTIIDDKGNWSGINANWNRPLNITSYSGQIGVKGNFNTGDVKHNLVMSVDKAWYDNYNGLPGGNNSNLFTGPNGNIYDGSVHGSIGNIPDVDPKISVKNRYWSWKLMDTLEYGKAQMLLGVTTQHVSNESYSYPAGSSKTVKSNATSPVYALVYKPTDKLSLHFSHSESFDKGTVVGSQYINHDQILAPAKTKQNELGVKYEMGKVLTSLTAFEIIQDSNIERGKYFVQDGESKYKGLELSAYGQLSDKWNIMGGIMYLDAKQTKTKNGLYDGIKVAGSSEWSGVIGLEYMPDDKLSVLGRGMYVGSASLNNEKYKVPSHLTFDLGMKYKTKISETPVTVSAMCYNVTGKDYWIAKTGVDTIMLSNPRTFMLSAQFDI